MCFSPKVKVPKMDTNQIRAVEPAPLTQEVSSVEFGGGSSDETDTEGTEVSGRKDLKVERDDSVAKSKAAGTGSARMKSSIRKSAFGGKK
ncbi:virion protein [Shigella phage ESh1]|nr:virion protein [Shigella phage ESh1]